MHFDPLIFVGVMSLGTQKILINDLVIATPLKLLIRFSWCYAPWNLENIRKSTNNLSFLCQFLPASPKVKVGLGVQSLRPSVRPSVSPSVAKSCHRNSSDTTDLIFMKLGMQIGHHMVSCISAGNFDPLIFFGVMPLGTKRIFLNQLTELRKYS